MAPFFAHAQMTDADKDGISDDDEINHYYTDPAKADTDGDGFTDREELIKGFSPLVKDKKKLEKLDSDKDGANDRLEINWRTNPVIADTDGDGIKDGDEIFKELTDPLATSTEKLAKRIEVDLRTQTLKNFVGRYKLNEFLVSSGARNTTPKGEYKVKNKNPKAWSSYGLWMPYWMGIEGQRFGLHELPIWPSGYREGESHLGRPVSHGCIRLGIGAAKTIYDWTEVGMKVFIK